MNKNLLTFFSCIMILGCTKPVDNSQIEATYNDSHPSEETTKVLPFNVTVLSFVDRKEFQIDISKERVVSAPINLTEEMGLPDGISPTITENLITYSSKFPEPSSFWSKNIKTGKIDVKVPFCNRLDGESTTYITNSSKYNISISTIGGYKDNGYDTYVKVYDSSKNDCDYIPLGIGLYSSATIYGDNLVVLGRSEQNIFSKLLFVDLNKKEVYNVRETRLSFATVFEKNIYLFASDGTLEIRDLKTWEVKDIIKFPNYAGYGERLFKTAFTDNRMEYRFPYAQPSQFAYGPIIYDFENGQSIGDNILWKVRSKLIEKSPSFNGVFTDYEVDLEKELILIGYGKSENEGPTTGGVLLANFQAEILDYIDLDYLPRNVIIRK